MEALEALFGLQLPLPPSAVRQYMQGIAAMMNRWVWLCVPWQLCWWVSLIASCAMFTCVHSTADPSGA